LGNRGVQIYLLTFEKVLGEERGNDTEMLWERLRGQGIRWTPLRYHKTPTIPATLYDIAVGVVWGTVIARRHGIGIIHARSYVPALIALALKQIIGAKFLFDMRGFWADERVEGKIWRSGSVLYRIAKAFERVYLKKADAVITLTDAARKEIEALEYLRHSGPPITTIPTCVDLDRFRDHGNGVHFEESSGNGDRFTLIYSGSLGTWYGLDEMMAFFAVARKHLPTAHFLILTQSREPDLEKSVTGWGFSEKDVTVRSVPFLRVPEHLAAGDVGIIFSRPCWSNKARCPTKLAEFLACGIPVVISQGIGDAGAIIQKERVGVIVEGFTEAAYEKALGAVRDLLGEKDLRARCREVATRYFSLDHGVLRYHQVYQSLLNVSPRPFA
jgi:glycosyltransferase involved in cell wall biosynthesis